MTDYTTLSDEFKSLLENGQENKVDGEDKGRDKDKGTVDSETDYQCKWEDGVPVSFRGHTFFFTRYLNTSGIFKRVCDTCPITYKSNNAPKISDVLATIFAGILEGNTRYRHFDNLSGDILTAKMFGIKKFMSCDSIRRAVEKMARLGPATEKWQKDIMRSLLLPVIQNEHILDLDPTIKPLYGHQEGAELGYNPHKPGRPSHCLHTLVIAEPRLVIAVKVRPGNETDYEPTRKMLEEYLDSIPPNLRPKLIRGDVAFGCQTMMKACEGYNLDYLFKLKRHVGVRSVLKGLPAEGWVDAGDGWQGQEVVRKLSCWDHERRIIFIRRIRTKDAKGKEGKIEKFCNVPLLPGFECEGLIPEVGTKDGKRILYEWQALVTSLDDRDYPMSAVAQLYRDRGDCENVFDEMKNQWGWSGFVTRKMPLCQIMAEITAIVANLWNIFVRLGNPEYHQEAKTSRLEYQSVIYRVTSHSRRQVVICSAANSNVRKKYNRIMSFLNKIRTASQLSMEEKWKKIVDFAYQKFMKNDRIFPASIGDQLMLPI